MIKLFFIILFTQFVFSSQVAAVTYEKKDRVKYIYDSLDIISKTDAREIGDAFKFIHMVYRTRCRSSFERLKIECLKQAANQSCLERRRKIKNCRIYSDVIIVNKLSEHYFLSVRKRYEIMKKSQDYRPAFVSQLNRLYAQLAADFALSDHYDCKSKDSKCLGNGIDNYCVESADYKGLSWQNCVSALSWFIGNSSR